MENPDPFVNPAIGKLLITVGLLLIIVGLVFMFKDRVPFLKGLGSLPGDIAIEKQNFKFYFPITTSILVSIVLSLIFWFFRK